MIPSLDISTALCCILSSWVGFRGPHRLAMGPFPGASVHEPTGVSDELGDRTGQKNMSFVKYPRIKALLNPSFRVPPLYTSYTTWESGSGGLAFQ